MIICELCKNTLPAGAGRIVLPQATGVITICMPCATMPRPVIEARAGAVVIDRDGREYPIEEASDER